MKLTESDLTLSETCRLVEEQIREVSHLRDVSLSVTLLPNFNALPYPVTPKDPAAYDGSKGMILVNAAVFPSLPSDVAQFVLTHEIGHHAHHNEITTSDPRFKDVHPCVVADWLAAQWGFCDGMKAERLAARGAEFCVKLSTIKNDEEFLRWVHEWQLRFRIAKLLGQPISSRSDAT